MKIVRITLAIICTICTTIGLSAQDKVENWDGKITLDGTDLKKEILVDVSNESDEISVSVEGKVSGGYVKVRLFNPMGIRVANLNLNAGRNGTAKGTMQESLETTTGTWKVKVVSENARRKVSIKVEQN